MQKLLSLILLILMMVVAFAQPQIPTKLFDVRSGNGVVDTGVTYPRATVVVFKDNTSKDALIDAFAAEYSYQAIVPNPAIPGQTMANPQSKQGFFNEKLSVYLKDIYKAHKTKAAAKAANDTAASAADAELP